MEGFRPGEEATDAVVGGTLRGGLYLSVAVMLLGALAALAAGRRGHSVVPLDRIPRVLAAGDPSALLDLGLLLLFATPLSGVAVALVRFMRERDGTFAALTAGLLAILVAGFVVALR